jgi:hypothetical protein
LSFEPDTYKQFSSPLKAHSSKKVLCLFSWREYIRGKNTSFMAQRSLNNVITRLTSTATVVVVIIIPAIQGGGW